MRFAVFITLCLFQFSLSFAQTDSVVILNTNWSITKIERGVQLRQHWFEQSLFQSNQNITILEVKLKGRHRVDVSAEPKLLKGTSEFGKANKAVAALNGTFFDIKNGGSVDYVRIDGKMLNPNRLSANGKRALHQEAAVITNKNKVTIAKWDGSADWEGRLPGEDVMITGPLLIYQGKQVKLDTTPMYVLRHPRSAIAIKGKRLWLITVDGRNQRAAGMTLFELAAFLKWMGADEAINLDGGGSTALWIKTEPEPGIVNYPSDNKKMEPVGKTPVAVPPYTQKWDHTGERPVANAIIITRKR